PHPDDGSFVTRSASEEEWRCCLFLAGAWGYERCSRHHGEPPAVGPNVTCKVSQGSPSNFSSLRSGGTAAAERGVAPRENANSPDALWPGASDGMNLTAVLAGSRNMSRCSTIASRRTVRA